MPTSLQGLNIVYPSPPPSDNAGQDLLALPPGFPDLSAQLDLWTNLSFASDEPFVPMDRKELGQAFRDRDKAEDLSGNHDTRVIADNEKYGQSAIENSILAVPPNNGQSSFDLRTFLAGFGIDPFLVPPQTSHPLLSTTIPPASSDSSSSDTSTSPHVPLDTDGQPPVKRIRTRESSTASQTPAVAPAALQQGGFSDDGRTALELSEDHDPLSTPLTAAEDKRRRNTAASARFRAKKKEREQALEKRSKELETKVTELERECEGLRRENGWLKGLVVGVTGGNPSGVPSVPTDGGGSGDMSDTSKGKRMRDVESTTSLSGA